MFLLLFHFILLQLLQQKEIVHHLKTRVIFNYFTFFFSSIAIFSPGYIEPSITMVIPVFKKMSAVDFILAAVSSGWTNDSVTGMITPKKTGSVDNNSHV